MEDIRLSEHFMLHEFTRSATALDLGIDNCPPRVAIGCLQILCERVLEPLRRRFGVIRITSGYRCEALNKAVGGAKNSLHRFGLAADIHIGSMEEGRKMFEYIRQNLLFDELLFEHSASRGTQWIHVAVRPDEKRNRRKAIADYAAT